VRILSVRYDPLLLQTRHQMLQDGGYEEVSAMDFMRVLNTANVGILTFCCLATRSLYSEKLKLVETFHWLSPWVVIALAAQMKRFSKVPITRLRLIHTQRHAVASSMIDFEKPHR
jgi:hypothetical protein